jgi:heterotetrameric sarcosine oxidase gamma subunit
VSAPEPACPFGAALPVGRYGVPTDVPVRITARRYSLVQLSARRGQSDALAGATRTAFGLDLPSPCRAAIAGELTALWMQPSTWLLMAPPAEPGTVARSVKDACGDIGSVVDQTLGWAVLLVSGARARDVLARICRLDLHPRAFHAGDVAVTPVAELACLLYQRDDTPRFELIVPASCAGWFAEAVCRAAMSIGYEIA